MEQPAPATPPAEPPAGGADDPLDPILESIARFLSRPSWRRLWRGASPRARARLAMSFYYSDRRAEPGFPIDDYRAARSAAEAALDDDDLRYLSAAEPLGEAARARYRSLLEARRPASK